MQPMAVIAGVMLIAATGASAAAENLSVQLPGVPVTRIQASFECGADGVALGLPAGPFTVEYLNAGKNHLAILPVHGQALIFSNVISGSGARYAAGRYIWWDAGAHGVTLYAEGVDGHPKAECHLVKKQ
ncbi:MULTISPECIES: MliC family protein [Acidobacteriaceae]|uniref:MliC family protein n=1 Tax=Acidobacteriaceae TaxID=204434 RepID=UPI001C20955C|nr:MULTISPECIES: MliC family protein [Acidobacteriaceae]MDW5267171.1 MliC family protein [Edaphobacter sp.]